MAAKMTKFYELVAAEGGLPAKMRLAMATGIPSTKAADSPDSPDLIAKFAAAYKDITGKAAPIN